MKENDKRETQGPKEGEKGQLQFEASGGVFFKSAETGERYRLFQESPGCYRHPNGLYVSKGE